MLCYRFCVCTDMEQASALLMCICKVLGSNLGQETYLLNFTWYSPVPAAKYQKSTLYYATADSFYVLSYWFRLIILNINV
jgi:hypothetical protein